MVEKGKHIHSKLTIIAFSIVVFSINCLSFAACVDSSSTVLSQDIPIAFLGDWILDSGSLLIDGRPVVKDEWTRKERETMFHVLKNMSPANKPEEAYVGAGFTLTTMQSEGLEITFIGEFVLVKQPSNEERWYNIKYSDYLLVHAMLFPELY